MGQGKVETVARRQRHTGLSRRMDHETHKDHVRMMLDLASMGFDLEPVIDVGRMGRG